MPLNKDTNNILDPIKPKLQKIVESLKSPFNTHQFIVEVKNGHRNAYEKLLKNNKDSQRNAHGQLGFYLSEEKEFFKIKKDKYVNSVNINGDSGRAMQWIKY